MSIWIFSGIFINKAEWNFAALNNVLASKDRIVSGSKSKNTRLNLDSYDLCD
jgi:hypothetical protein